MTTAEPAATPSPAPGSDAPAAVGTAIRTAKMAVETTTTPTAADASPRGARTERATLGSVAARAGVSRQTVSNVLNSPDLVRPETADRVRKAIAALSYRPHLAAQQLRTRRSQLLGMRIHQAPEPTIFDRFLHAVTEAAAAADYRVILYTAPDDESEIDAYDELLDRWNVDGLLLTYTHAGDRRTDHLHAQGVPFVTFGRPWDAGIAHSWVDVDGSAGTRAATRHLLSGGHRRIGFLGWPEDSDVGSDRLSGWASSMSAAGLPAPEPRRCLNDIESARAAARQLLDTEDVTAIVCVSDIVALGALAAADQLGLRAGSDLAVVGFDDSDKAQGADLTSLAQPLRAVAEHCLRILLNQITASGQGPPPEQVLLPPTLALRGSTASVG